MLPTVPVPPKRLEDYREAAGGEAVDRLREAARPLRGARVLHVNSTPFGGGVAELLFAQVALLNDLGIETTWQVIEGSDDFFTVTKFMHNGLQGADVPWTEEMAAVYLDRVRANAAELPDGHDFHVIHDPQPAALLSAVEEEGRRAGRWVWRCHLDLADPMPSIWSFLAGHAERYDAVVFSTEESARWGLAGPAVACIAPSIDPVSMKNVYLDQDTIFQVLRRYGIDRQRPIATQVSRFDPWKDPVGVIEAYRLARRDVPGLQLVLAGSMAHDDPEGWHYLQLTEDRRDGDPDIHLLTNFQEVGDLQVNAFQRASTVVVQKSLREGFGLTVSEAMWKEKPVIGGDVGGIRLQIEDGVSGCLVASVEECAARMVELLSDPDLRARIGKAARSRVAERFLTLRELEDYLRLLAAMP